MKKKNRSTLSVATKEDRRGAFAWLPYLQAERVEGHLGNGGHVEVEGGQPEVLQLQHHLQQLLRPPPGEDLEVGVALHHGHLYVSHSRPVLRRPLVRAVIVCDARTGGRILGEGEEVGERSRAHALLDSLSSLEGLDQLFELFNEVYRPSDDRCLITLFMQTLTPR